MAERSKKKPLQAFLRHVPQWLLEDDASAVYAAQFRTQLAAIGAYRRALKRFDKSPATIRHTAGHPGGTHIADLRNKAVAAQNVLSTWFVESVDVDPSVVATFAAWYKRVKPEVDVRDNGLMSFIRGKSDDELTKQTERDTAAALKAATAIQRDLDQLHRGLRSPRSGVRFSFADQQRFAGELGQLDGYVEQVRSKRLSTDAALRAATLARITAERMRDEWLGHERAPFEPEFARANRGRANPDPYAPPDPDRKRRPRQRDNGLVAAVQAHRATRAYRKRIAAPKPAKRPVRDVAPRENHHLAELPQQYAYVKGVLDSPQVAPALSVRSSDAFKLRLAFDTLVALHDAESLAQALPHLYAYAEKLITVSVPLAPADVQDGLQRLRGVALTGAEMRHNPRLLSNQRTDPRPLQSFDDGTWDEDKYAVYYYTGAAAKRIAAAVDADTSKLGTYVAFVYPGELGTWAGMAVYVYRVGEGGTAKRVAAAGLTRETQEFHDVLAVTRDGWLNVPAVSSPTVEHRHIGNNIDMNQLARHASWLVTKYRSADRAVKPSRRAR